MKANAAVPHHDLQKSLADLRKLRSAIREDLRVAGAGARQQWKKFLEPQLTNAEKLIHEIGQASRAAVTRTAAAFGEFRTSLKKTAPRARRIKVSKRASSARG